MVETMQYAYQPDYVVKPGDVLEEMLDTLTIKKNDLAQRCDLSTKTISQIISGNAPISPETALCFQKVLKVHASIWNNLEANYRLSLARRSTLEEFGSSIDWANGFPLKQLIERGYIEKREKPAEIVEQVLAFFGVGSVSAWEAKYGEVQVAFRCSPSFKSSREAVSAWLRIGEICASKVECQPFNKATFLAALDSIRALTSEDPVVFEPRMRKLCADAGVALVFVREFPKTHLSGATEWISKDKALLMLSLRHKRDDYFWFSFFHEAGHIIQGGKKSIFLDEMNGWACPEEDLANEFASNMLIPEGKYRIFVANQDFSPTAVRRFAAELGIAPSIIVGRLQHNKEIGWQELNFLTRQFELVEACG
jgi:addiction module HigA family antidote